MIDKNKPDYPYLAYSQLTDKVYIVINSKNKKDITSEFLGTTVLWMEQGKPISENVEFERTLMDKDKNPLYIIKLQLP